MGLLSALLDRVRIPLAGPGGPSASELLPSPPPQEPDPEGYVPFERGVVHTPAYYLPVGGEPVKVGCAQDVAVAFGLDAATGHAAVLAMTAGRTGSSRRADLVRAISEIVSAIGHPPGRPYETGEVAHGHRLDLAVVVPDVQAVFWAFQLDWWRSSALKYLVRAGRKPGERRDKDLSKAAEVLQALVGFVDGG